MKIHDLSGSFETDDTSQLAERLRGDRRDAYGAFHVSGDDAMPYISAHFNGDIAYVHYFATDGHPGFQPTDMTPNGCPDEVHFLNTDGAEAGAIDMPASALVDADTAIQAILEFAASGQMPQSIQWFEL
ncbi:Imm1 family immunity protein [Rhodopirellula europaea]|uniref:Imm1 family immunity protein n=1 Tax=Rhodopirellula europaea TaxID=1263866 RepID=UPI003D296872|tara:strand:- start:11331 stop:11717 length:387 start_codon:yes stop_codon:yes gene_type:complete